MNHASLFSGIGGPEIAAAMLGWENLFHCEINPFGRKVLDYWFPKSKSYEDITKTDFTEWRGRVDVLTGGFPCQPFSYAGQRRGADDDRCLWPYIFKAIDAIRPSWVVAENVAGITTMVEQGDAVEVGKQASLFEEVDDIYRYRLTETFTLQRICDDLESFGYSVQPVLIPACAVGAPHRRDRVFIVAYTEWATADTTSEQSGQLQPGQPRRCESKQGQLGKRGGEDSAERFDANTSDIGAGQREQTERQECGRPSLSEFGERYGASLSADGGICGERWQNFPTVSPVHRGNDGIPFDVDGLSVPFSKWRTESLKAYGNAIVPQVMYEIFRAIELAEKQTKN